MKKNELKKGLETMQVEKPKTTQRKQAKIASPADLFAVQTIYLRHKFSWHRITQERLKTIENYVVESYIPAASTAYITQVS